MNSQPSTQNLVIVESPTKAKTLVKFLGKGYDIVPSMGHIIDLPGKELGVDVERGFTPTYVVMSGKGKTVSAIKKAAVGADKVFLATDPDREGEAIAYHVAGLISSISKIKDQDVKRVVFHEITREAIEEAFQHPRQVDQALVNSQQARRILDRLVGYKLSPLLWKKVRRGLSAGRVQSVAVRLIVEREREREVFNPEEYWEIVARLQKTGESPVRRGGGENRGVRFEAKLVEKDGEKIKIGAKEDADATVADLQKAGYQISKIEKSQRRRNPFPPFTTSTLQQAAVNVFGFSGKRTMRAAQSLYEAGLITYHRTDSVALSEKALGSIRDFVSKEFGAKYLPEGANRYKTKVRLAQEAHEAIRPTVVGRMPGDSGTGELGRDEKKIYDLIWKRAVASQTMPSIYDQTRVEVFASRRDSTSNYLLLATGSRLAFDGWERIFGDKQQEEELPELVEGENLSLIQLTPSQHFTEPPARYTEATLIKKLEEEGIGRPSTYAPIISTIQDRGYVIKEGKALRPEDVGTVVNDLLVSYFPDVVDVSFTAKMEGELDEIAKGDKEGVAVLQAFYGPFSEELKEAQENIDRSSVTTLEETDEKCPECARPLVVKLGRYGRFYSCSGFPECKYTKPFIETIGMKCPDCKEGDVVVKRTKRGKAFYGCSRYPECKWASWTNPLKQSGKDKEDH
jgi:DNA topoisomerase-1